MSSARWLERAVAPAIAALHAEGVTAIALPLHGARAEVHDWVAGRPSAFRESLDALQAARALRLEVTIWTTLTRSNARVLTELPSLLKARGAIAWVVVIAELGVTSVVPRFGMAVPSALAAIDDAVRLGIDARIHGAPRCVLGRFAARATASAPRAFGRVCEGCPSRASCPGVDAAYLERFGESELHATSRTDPGPPLVFQGAPR